MVAPNARFCHQPVKIKHTCHFAYWRPSWSDCWCWLLQWVKLNIRLGVWRPSFWLHISYLPVIKWNRSRKSQLLFLDTQQVFRAFPTVLLSVRANTITESDKGPNVGAVLRESFFSKSHTDLLVARCTRMFLGLHRVRHRLLRQTIQPIVNCLFFLRAIPY